MAKKAKRIFETSVERLDEIIELLESEETILDDSIKLYKEGVGLLETCVSELHEAELVMAELRKRSDGVFEILNKNEAE